MSTNRVLDAYSTFRREVALLRSDELKELDFGPKQLMILFSLRTGAATMSELAAYTYSDKASATRAVDSMVRAGFLRRSDRDDDKRVTVIELTSKGRTRAAKAEEVRNAIGKRIGETLNANEQKQLAGLLEKVASGLRERREQSV